MYKQKGLLILTTIKMRKSVYQSRLRKWGMIYGVERLIVKHHLLTIKIKQDWVWMTYMMGVGEANCFYKQGRKVWLRKKSMLNGKKEMVYVSYVERQLRMRNIYCCIVVCWR